MNRYYKSFHCKIAASQTITIQFQHQNVSGLKQSASDVRGLKAVSFCGHDNNSNSSSSLHDCY